MKNYWLIEKRDQKKLSQLQVAEAVGIDRSYFAKIEGGLAPSVTVAKKIANFFNFDWTLFFNENCAKNTQKKEVS